MYKWKITLDRRATGEWTLTITRHGSGVQVVNLEGTYRHLLKVISLVCASKVRWRRLAATADYKIGVA